MRKNFKTKFGANLKTFNAGRLIFDRKKSKKISSRFASMLSGRPDEAIKDWRY